MVFLNSVEYFFVDILFSPFLSIIIACLFLLVHFFSIYPEYLEDKKIDSIKDDQEFVEAEYNAVRTYCENCGYRITYDDLVTINLRGLMESYEDWRQAYYKEL